MSIWRMAPVLLCLGSMTNVAAEDRVELQGTSIIGNRELPKVLYIAPWREPSPADLERPATSLLNEALEPLDREVFVRQVEYQRRLQDR